MYEFGTFAVVNGNIVDSKYEIQTGDIVGITVINKLSELLSAIDFDTTNCKFQKGKVIINADYYLCENDVITSFKVAPKSEPTPAPAVTQSIAQPVEVYAPQPEIAVIPEVTLVPEQPIEPIIPAEIPAQPVFIPTPAIKILLNGRDTVLPEKSDNSPHLFLEVLNLVDIDLTRKQGVLIMTINGKNAQYTSTINNNDSIQIYWG